MTTLDYQPVPTAAGAGRRQLLHALFLLGPLLALAGVIGLFAVIAPRSFLTPDNLVTILRQSAITGIAALGMTIIVIAGGIDLSVGSMIALVTVIIAKALQAKFSPLSAVGFGIAAGAMLGLMNGLLITLLRVGPFIVTLGTLLVYRGWAKGIAHNNRVLAPHSWLNTLLAPPPPSRAWLIIPPGVWTMLILAVLVAALLRFTRLGRHIFAVGSNEQTARLCGINVTSTKLAVYAIGGGLTAVGALMMFARLTVGSPTSAEGLELDIIAAVVIGGGSLAGGQGSILGSVVGALIMIVIRSGCAHMGLEDWVQQIVTGHIIVLAVALDRLRRHLARA